MSDFYIPKLTQLPADLLSLADYERLAKHFIPHPIFEYIDGGVGDDITRNSNSNAFDPWQIVPRQLRSFAASSTQTRWFNNLLQHPIGLAPVAYQKLVHPNGEIASAQAAEALGSLFITSSLSSSPLEEIAAQVHNHWFQLYWQNDRQRSLQLVRRAEACGCQALVITVDVPVNGLRQRPQRAGFQLPPEVRAVNIDHAPAQTMTLNPDESPILALMRQAPNWDDLRWLRDETELPLVIKGILHPEDAAKAKACGADGIIVSNHGGRSLDGVPSSVQMLPSIRTAVGNEMLVLLDSGVRRGTDAFKALALGANGVLIGRPIMNGLAVAGALGVAHSLKLLNEELEMTMALAGCPTLADIDRSALLHTHPSF